VEKCRAKSRLVATGARFEFMYNANTDKKLLFIFIIIVGIILSGIALGFLYNSLPANNPQKSKQGCESVGGDWSEEQNKCLVSYKEAGGSCTDGGQCTSGVCFPPTLTAEQEIELGKGPLKNIIGTCYPDELVSGCIRQVLKGTISKESMCLDS
jgi:hypothetical protein